MSQGGGGAEDHTQEPSTQYPDRLNARETSDSMEINNRLSHLSHNDIPTTSSLLYQMHAMPHINLSDPDIHNDIRAQLVNIDKYYRLQEEALIQQCEKQRQLLQNEQQIKMQEKIKHSPFIYPQVPTTANAVSPQMQMLMLQKQQEVEQAILEQQQQEAQKQLHQQAVQQQTQIHHIDPGDRNDIQLARIKNKPKGERSARASDPVKAKLRECLLQKNARDPNLKDSPPTLRNWATQHSSLEQNSPPTSGLSPPLRGPQILACYDDENPLRRTVSEPTLIMKRPKLASHHRHQNSLHPLYSPRMNRRNQLRKNHNTSNSLFSE